MGCTYFEERICINSNRKFIYPSLFSNFSVTVGPYTATLWRCSALLGVSVLSQAPTKVPCVLQGARTSSAFKMSCPMQIFEELLQRVRGGGESTHAGQNWGVCVEFVMCGAVLISAPCLKTKAVMEDEKNYDFCGN
jgi:hypothetical protein